MEDRGHPEELWYQENQTLGYIYLVKTGFSLNTLGLFVLYTSPDILHSES